MAEAKLPYVSGYGRISTALEKIKSAATPDRFTRDFLQTTLQMKGGSAHPLIPFLKRTGFLRSDGSPTDLYSQFRNSAESGIAAGQALRIGYAPLYEINESVHDLGDEDVLGLIVQFTGLKGNSSTVRAILGSFKALRDFADFSANTPTQSAPPSEPAVPATAEPTPHSTPPRSLSIGYTINLHLPATSDIAVFNAIFKSLRENLLGSDQE